MATATVSPKLVSAEPTVINTGTDLYVSLPLMNVGTGDALQVFVTGFTVGSAPRLSPAAFPYFVGDVAVGNTGATNARFNALAIVPGQKHLLTVRGTYKTGEATMAFAVNRYLTVPIVTPYPVALVKAHVQVLVQPGVWNYMIVNDEPEDSQQFLAGFSLSIAAPVTVTGTPPGWIVETDNLSYVGWVAADESLPYPNHVRPGSLLGGFQIKSPTSRSESTPYLLTSWRQDTDEAGLIAADFVLTPSRAL